MSEARLRLPTGQTMMAASPPPNTGTQEQGFRENFKPWAPSLFALPGGNFCDLGSASSSQNSFEGQLSRSGLAIWASAQGCWMARHGKGWVWAQEDLAQGARQTILKVVSGLLHICWFVLMRAVLEAIWQNLSKGKMCNFRNLTYRNVSITAGGYTSILNAQIYNRKNLHVQQ